MWERNSEGERERVREKGEREARVTKYNKRG